MLISEIIGIESKYIKLLEKEGITQVEELLPLSTYKLKQIAEKTGISLKLLDTWQEHGDLMRIEGIDPKYAYALNEIGIDSVRELANRNAKSTADKLKDFRKNNSKILDKIPSIDQIQLWIKHAQQIKDLPPTIKPKEDGKEEEEFGNYGAEYWNNKWIRSPIIYAGRALRGEEYNTQIDVDVKTFLKKNDEILNYIIQERDLKKPTYNETALACQQFVCNFLKYKFDEESSECPEFWQFPFESIQFGIGDCEDGAILIAGLAINAGVPSYRIKVCAGNVLADPKVAPSEDNLGGHGYAIYLADKDDSERGLEWVILDWCYLPDPEILIEKKPLAKNGGKDGAYQDVWFTFNDEYSWSQNEFEIIQGRISNKRKTKKREVISEIENMVERILKDLNLEIEEED
ncbi:MAG: DUF4332 domain-containing protein [Candidatus Lokiarchaeota archaeon]|nr:DUF4332 domain-containing protein [Candidatus Lokiarchaeota archaeon]